LRAVLGSIDRVRKKVLKVVEGNYGFKIVVRPTVVKPTGTKSRQAELDSTEKNVEAIYGHGGPI
jgi:hypothetical protein